MSTGKDFALFNFDAVLNVRVHQELLDAVDAARGDDPRAIYVRQAVAEKLEREGKSIPEGMIYGPDTTPRRKQ